MYQFTDDCMIGVRQIDEEHRQLFDLINRSMELVRAGKVDVAIVKSTVQKLKEYASIHFEHEEQYMVEIRDPELPIQRKEHRDFVKKIEDISLENLKEDRVAGLMEEILEYLTRWLYHHILSSDMMIGQMKPMGQKNEIFVFTEDYRIGNEMIDREHEKLFEIVRDVDDLIHAQFMHDKYDAILDVLDDLKGYTVRHFGDEEAYMARIGYAGLEEQRRAHESFVRKFEEIDLKEVDEYQQRHLQDIIDFLMCWLVNHILSMDKKIPV